MCFQEAPQCAVDSCQASDAQGGHVLEGHTLGGRRGGPGRGGMHRVWLPARRHRGSARVGSPGARR
eukprot:12363134-Alexandrium_andersonii.AAC.1